MNGYSLLEHAVMVTIPKKLFGCTQLEQGEEPECCKQGPGVRRREARAPGLCAWDEHASMPHGQ
jgi:hypothetical protein